MNQSYKNIDLRTEMTGVQKWLEGLKKTLIAEAKDYLSTGTEIESAFAEATIRTRKRPYRYIEAI